MSNNQKSASHRRRLLVLVVSFKFVPITLKRNIGSKWIIVPQVCVGLSEL